MPIEIAVTGGSGRLGRVVIDRLLRAGHRVRSLDRVAAPSASSDSATEGLRRVEVDLNNLQALTDSVRGCEAIIHLAAYPGPFGYPPGQVYVNNTVSGYNVLHAAASLGIRRVCLASSVNALGGIDSKVGRFDYFPVDELHPTYNEDDYSLSKWVMEQQGDSFGRRYPTLTISSLRFHALVPEPPELQHSLDTASAPVARNLWGWTLIHEGARACELAIQADYSGHEVFYIIAPRTFSAIPSLELAAHAYPDVPIHGDLSGHTGFFDCRKAARLLGWVHITG